MATETLESRVSELESRVKEMQAQLAAPTAKRGWRAIVGIHAGNPRFDEAERLGREWRNADGPKDAGNSG